MSWKGIALFLDISFFSKKIKKKYTLLPSFYSYLTFVICVNIKQVPWKQRYLMIPKCWELEERGEKPQQIKIHLSCGDRRNPQGIYLYNEIAFYSYDNGLS